MSLETAAYEKICCEVFLYGIYCINCLFFEKNRFLKFVCLNPNDVIKTNHEITLQSIFLRSNSKMVVNLMNFS